MLHINLTSFDLDEESDYVIFFCGHIYHQRCVRKKNEVSYADMHTLNAV